MGSNKAWGDSYRGRENPDTPTTGPGLVLVLVLARGSRVHAKGERASGRAGSMSVIACSQQPARRLVKKHEPGTGQCRRQVIR